MWCPAPTTELPAPLLPRPTMKERTREDERKGNAVLREGGALRLPPALEALLLFPLPKSTV